VVRNEPHGVRSEPQNGEQGIASGAPGSPAEDSGAALEDDVAIVAELLGRAPRGAFAVVVRADDGTPRVIRNQPLLDDGTPMPTRYWLVDRELNRRIGRLEADGGVRRAEAAVDVEELAAAHERYRAERDAAIPADWDGPVPFGGVGGTRRGVKCLHTHYAWFLAGGDDPVGRWVDLQLDTAADGPPADDPSTDTGAPRE
jgi:hypothetical protein